MRVLKGTYRRVLAILFIASMIGPLPVLRAQQNGQQQTGQPIIITFGQPNIWSLEQAHYLLARMRAQAEKLQSKAFGDGDLDPNEVNSTRLDALKELLGIGVGFNQGTGFQNDQAKKELTFNQDRRHTLLAQRDQRQAEVRTVNDQLATLRIDRERMNESKTTTDEEKKTKDVEIEQKIQQQTQLNGEIQSLTSEINGITATSTGLTSPSPPPMPSPMGDSVVDALVKSNDFQKQLFNLPNLGASTKLDNYLNLQYEIIAKQLTTMRDEVGPGQRLVFVELPQSFYTVPDKANRMVAQVWWHVDKYYEHVAERQPDAGLPRDSDCAYEDQPDDVIKPNRGALERRLKCNPYSTDRPRTEEDIKKAIAVVKKNSDPESLREENKRILRQLESNPEGFLEEEKRTLREWHGGPAGAGARTLDLIPRQSALNVNDIQDKEKNFNLMGLFSWLSGLGVSINYQRQRDIYQQFLQQEVYASAFGKGTDVFGWTFGPKPGTERIAPGLQNTYAVLVVPENAYALTLTATGCYFPRTAYAPADFDSAKKCGNAPTSFDLIIPSTTQNNFWVTGLQYRPVRPGQRVIVHVSGEYFSPQIGVLVNGVALRHSIGLAQSELAVTRTDDSFEPTPVGDFEFVNSKQLVLAFSLGDFKGTPTITLVTPGRARVINNLRLVINDSYTCTKKNDTNCPQGRDAAQRLLYDDHGNPRPVPYKNLLEELENSAVVPDKDSIWVKLDAQAPMFSDASVLAIDDLKVLKAGSQTFVGHLTGSKFDSVTEVLVNNYPADFTILATGLFEIEFPATDSPNLEVTVIHRSEKDKDEKDKNKKDKNKNDEDSTYATKSFPNPNIARVDKISITHYQADAKPNPILGLSLEGVGLDYFSQVEIPGAKSFRKNVSPTTMTLELKLDPKDKTIRDIIIVNLTDPRTKRTIPVVIDRPAEAASSGSERANDETASGTKPTKPSKPGRKPNTGTKPTTRRKPRSQTKPNTSTQQPQSPTKP